MMTTEDCLNQRHADLETVFPVLEALAKLHYPEDWILAEVVHLLAVLNHMRGA
jgi:hypothetical protein